MPRPSILHLSSSALWVASLALHSALRIGPQEAPRISSALRAAWRAHRSCSRTHMLDHLLVIFAYPLPAGG
jgi:hypothetical protein